MTDEYFPALIIDRPGGMLRPCVGRKINKDLPLASWNFQIRQQCRTLEEAREMAGKLNEDIDGGAH